MSLNERERESVRPMLVSSLVALLASGCFYLPSFASEGTVAAPEAKTEAQAKGPESVIPVPRPDAWWKDNHDALLKETKAGHHDIVFFGDSITAGMNVDLLHSIIGPDAVNFGIGGDQTQHLLWRMQNGELDFSAPAPRAFVMLIGTNNLTKWGTDPATGKKTSLMASTNQEICQGVEACLTELRSRFPQAKILVLGILPRDANPDASSRQRIKDTNVLLQALADNKHIFYADIGSSMLESDGKIAPAVMSDFLHPTKVEGYQRMFAAIKPHLDGIL
jgi:lysophospholipase L1-like esterase